mmetsp:Transcript_108304/g.282589  ORF Transcript_108304/g.282589 Transcript_108304/m.282589 type:complete len:215 (-) Transcript_108304:365-1009(-)
MELLQPVGVEGEGPHHLPRGRHRRPPTHGRNGRHGVPALPPARVGQQLAVPPPHGHLLSQPSGAQVEPDELGELASHAGQEPEPVLRQPLLLVPARGWLRRLRGDQRHVEGVRRRHAGGAHGFPNGRLHFCRHVQFLGDHAPGLGQVRYPRMDRLPLRYHQEHHGSHHSEVQRRRGQGHRDGHRRGRRRRPGVCEDLPRPRLGRDHHRRALGNI